MNRLELTPQQLEQQEDIRVLVDTEVAPHADRFDQQERIPAELIQQLAERGYFGATIPQENGGLGWDVITFGLLCEELGRGSASLLSLFTVHGMVTQALSKWGTPSQKERWLPQLATGRIQGAFGLTEPATGSDGKSVETRAVLADGMYHLNGTKKWISCGQIADVFLIIAQCDGKPSAFLVEKDSPGFSLKPIAGMLGFRAAMLAELHMEECRIPEEHLVGKVGFGFSHVAGSALDYGRYCIAWGAVGLSQACLEASLHYVNERKQFDAYLRDHQLIQQMLADMITGTKAARSLCYNAGYLKDRGDPESILETSIAKYYASTTAAKIASDAVQIHGANGCSSEFPVQRYMRDAKVMEIIEGSSQIQQILIARYGKIFWGSPGKSRRLDRFKNR